MQSFIHFTILLIADIREFMEQTLACIYRSDTNLNREMKLKSELTDANRRYYTTFIFDCQVPL